MYLAPTISSNNDKIVSCAITSFLLLGFYLTLRWAGLPEVKQKTENYEEINWTRFRPMPEKIVQKPQPAKPPKVAQPAKVQPSPEPTPRMAKKIDLSALRADFEKVAQPTRSLQREAPQTSGPAAANASAKINLKKSSVLGGLNTLLGGSSKKLKIGGRGNKGRGGKASTLRVASASSLSAGSNGVEYSGRPSLGAPEAKNTGAAAVQIDMVDLGEMIGGGYDLSPVYHELVAWMKQHPARFPKIVNRFMERAPGDLTSLVSFQIDGRQFDMYLLCKENLFEIRVCLIEGNESTYLIDRGFKESSSYLRVGDVNRVATGDILSFHTTRKAASNRRTAQFYQIFLSWWGTEK